MLSKIKSPLRLQFGGNDPYIPPGREERPSPGGQQVEHVVHDRAPVLTLAGAFLPVVTGITGSETEYSGHMAAHSRVLTGLDGQSYHFEPGNFCLELLVTGGPGPGEAYEILHAPADLATWLLDSRLTETSPLKPGDVRITKDDLVSVVRFRNTMWAVVQAVVDGGKPEKEHLRLINDAVGPQPRVQIDLATRSRRWATPITGREIVGLAAREAIEILDSPRLRQCAGDNCYLLFLDTSRPGNRRWCSMERCGNRHKVREHRARKALP